MADRHSDVELVKHLYSDSPRSPSGTAAIAALQSLSRNAQEAEELALRRLGVGPLDARALLYLVQRERDGAEVRARDLISALRVTSAAITKLIDRLATAGRVERRPDPADRRATVLTVSASTRAELAEVYGHVHVPLVTVLDGFTDEELAVLTRFSTRLAGALRAETHGDDATTGPLRPIGLMEPPVPSGD
ncbi:MarR family winged helix-turn-helix transcriptional regulator [Labedella phragmitis]|uniref:MarR family winged helix-turn-helix transcriptional regulator n=1 Tax=Labedella phragmitis TaxID=2498849 RepID=UPI00140A97C4|nr:MarR family transcriptional regulator [Labedella phragmitis]